MLLKLVYNNTYKDIEQELTTLCSGADICMEAYDEDYYKDIRKSKLIKASCGTKITPFIAIYDDTKEGVPLIKAFYGEDNTNNIKEIKSWMSTMQKS